MNADENNYVKAWRHILDGWLHWPEERIQRWARAREADLEDRGSVWFYTETATHYMISLLIRDSLDERLRVHSRGTEKAMDLIYFRRELFEAMDRGTYEFDDNYDWEAARNRVEVLLARYGESIPTAQEVTEYEIRMVQQAT